jgi:hypothetical protein
MGLASAPAHTNTARERESAHGKRRAARLANATQAHVAVTVASRVDSAELAVIPVGKTITWRISSSSRTTKSLSRFGKPFLPFSLRGYPDDSRQATDARLPLWLEYSGPLHSFCVVADPWECLPCDTASTRHDTGPFFVFTMV